jgi:hypothetical protein
MPHAPVRRSSQPKTRAIGRLDRRGRRPRILGLALRGAIDPSQAATSCVVLPREGKLAPHAAEARRSLASYVPELPGAWEVKSEQARQNRNDLSENRITAREADDRGGLAVGGTFLVPVLPTLYNNSTPTVPHAEASLQLRLFGPSRPER